MCALSNGYVVDNLVESESSKSMTIKSNDN